MRLQSLKCAAVPHATRIPTHMTLRGAPVRTITVLVPVLAASLCISPEHAGAHH